MEATKEWNKNRKQKMAETEENKIKNEFKLEYQQNINFGNVDT